MKQPENSPRGVITNYLEDWRSGKPDALNSLTAAIYAELRRLAAAVIQKQQSPQTIFPTELVHELYMELKSAQSIDATSRIQFLNLAARIMRNVLVDHARSRNASKRGGGMIRVELGDHLDARTALDVLVVHDMLRNFAENFPRQAEVVDLRFFSGLTPGETLEVLHARGFECSLRTVERDWRFARAWLENALDGRQPN